MTPHIVIIGAGITGLTLGYYLHKAELSVTLLEQSARYGGQIRTLQHGEFTFETGPNTGTLSSPEVVELLEQLPSGFEIASPLSRGRWILKGGELYRLPHSLTSGLTTPLFSWRDKLGILAEPWRRRGTDPHESVGALAQRRLGQSIYRYAVNPFIGGIYAGDPMLLETRYALPKLYALEQTYGSFIRGAIAKQRMKKDPRDQRASKEIFSCRGGLEQITQSLASAIGTDRILTDSKVVDIAPIVGSSNWRITYQRPGSELTTLEASHVVTTSGAYTLDSMLGKSLPQALLTPITRLLYAPVVEVAVGFARHTSPYHGFGALIPSFETASVLGVLFPSDCFEGRTPAGGALYSIFMGGQRQPELLQLNDSEIETHALNDLYRLIHIDPAIQPEFVHLVRHTHAIPQYSFDSEERYSALASIRQQYPGLFIAGNCCDGIGMAHRITQATHIANEIIAALQP